MNTTEIWQHLVTTALLGTERKPFAPPEAEGMLGGLLAAGENTPERGLLSAAAALAQFRRTGAGPKREQEALPAASPQETMTLCSVRAGRHLAQLLGGQHRDLLPEWLELAASNGRRVPPAQLPALLELGRTQQALRPRILAVLGERGRWLAAQNPEWSYASVSADDESLADPAAAWATADRAARLALLVAVRQHAPEQANTLIASTWGEEKADDRSAFLGALEAGLSMADEPLLERALDDRSKEVRRTAADMLARMPGSQLSARMRARASALLTLKRRLLRSPILEIRLPEQCDEGMIRDGIEPKPHGALGEKAWWLHQMLYAITPGFWNNMWGISPAEVIGAAAQSEWKELLLGAWIASTVRHRDAAWAEALLASDSLPVGAEAETLIGVMPAERRERFMTRLLRENAPLAPALLRQCTHRWSEAFARAVVRYFHERIVSKAGQPNWLLLALVKESALYAPPAISSELIYGWPIDAPSWQSWHGAVERFVVVLQFRTEMHNAFQQPA